MTALADLLLREADLIREFIDTLSTEQEALKRGEANALAALGGRKSELVEQLNAIDGERNAWLRQAGQSGDRAGMQAWLARNRNDRAAASAWVKLMKLAAEARELHNLNAKLLAMRLHATNQALSVLTQQAQRSSLYGRDGHTAQSTGSRIIDAA